MPEIIVTTVDLLRHGEPVGGRKYRGQTNDPLSEKGWAQMRAAVNAHAPWNLIVSSTLIRCLAFAEELAQQKKLPLETEPRFMEVGFGAWEGKTREEITRDDPDRLRRFYDDPMSNAPNGAEPLSAFHARVSLAWREMLARHTGKHLLAVGHAGMIRMILSEVLGIPLKHVFRINVPTAGLTRVEVEHVDTQTRPSLIFHAGRI